VKLHARPQFIRDAGDCAEYLEDQAGEEVVAAWRAALRRTLALIARFPQVGRLRQDLPQPGIRTLNLRPYPDYLVFYRIEGGHIELLRVRHGMMHLPDLFSEAPPAQTPS
jgi:plasmid stabilization system protein ParE